MGPEITRASLSKLVLSKTNFMVHEKKNYLQTNFPVCNYIKDKIVKFTISKIW